MADQVTTSRTGVNIVSQWTLHIVAAVVNLFLVAYVLTRVGKEAYGGWAAIASIIGYVYLLDAGLSVAIQHYMASHAARGDRLAMCRTFSSVYAVYGASAILGLLACLAVAQFYPFLFPKIPYAAADQCRHAMFWVAPSTGLLLLNMPVQGSLLGLQRFHLRNLAETLALLARAGVTVLLFVTKGPSLVHLGTAYFVSVCVRFALSVLFLRLAAPEIRFSPRLITKDTVGQVFSYGGHSAIWTLCNVVMRYSGPILAALILGPVQATYLYVGTRLVEAFGGLVSGAGAVFVPLASSLHATVDKSRLSSVLVRGTRLGALLALAGSACLIIFGQAILDLWVGPGYQTAYWILTILAIGRLGTWTFVVPEAVLMGTRALKFVTTLQITRAVLSITLGMLLAKLWGLLGLAAGMVAPLLITSSLNVPLRAAQGVGMSLRSLYRRALVWPLGVAAVTAVTAWALQRLFPADRVGILLLEMLAVLCVFGVLSLWKGLDNNTKRMLLAKISPKRPSKPIYEAPSNDTRVQ